MSDRNGTAGLRDYRRMPAGFGPTPGPRNLPADREHLRYTAKSVSISITARTDHDALSAILPDALMLGEHALLNISVVQLRELGWLAGRGYNILALAVPVVSRADPSVSGNLLPVLWENLAEPILTGREEIGYPKIFADLPDPVYADGGCSGIARWDGFEFFNFEMRELRPEDPPSAPPAAPPRIFTHKYLPSTFKEGRADISYLTSSNGPGEHREIRTGTEPVIEHLGGERGKGSFAFRHARWEDMPTQFHIVNRLADLPLHGFQSARIVRRSGQGDASDQHIFG